MAVYYLDTSALVKRYAREAGSRWMLSLTAPNAGHDLYTAQVTGPEMIAALFRKVRTGEIGQADARRAANDFRADWHSQYQVVEVTVNVIDRAMVLAEKHILRGYDAMHLAAALELQALRQGLALPSLIFVSADEGQLAVGRAEGLATENPNHHP